ncbi:MAG: hypothetical protein ACXWTJ_17180, partial [Bdellovibrionota bacterium]
IADLHVCRTRVRLLRAILALALHLVTLPPPADHLTKLNLPVRLHRKRPDQNGNANDRKYEVS